MCSFFICDINDTFSLPRPEYSLLNNKLKNNPIQITGICNYYSWLLQWLPRRQNFRIMAMSASVEPFYGPRSQGYFHKTKAVKRLLHLERTCARLCFKCIWKTRRLRDKVGSFEGLYKSPSGGERGPCSFRTEAQSQRCFSSQMQLPQSIFPPRKRWVNKPLTGVLESSLCPQGLTIEGKVMWMAPKSFKAKVTPPVEKKKIQLMTL